MFYCVKIYNNFINKISLLNTVFCNSNNLNNSFYNQYEKYFNNYVIEFDNIIFNNKKEKIINLINMKFNITSDNIYSFYELFDRWAKYINNFNDIDFKNEIINTIDYIKYFIDKYIDNKFEDNILTFPLARLEPASTYPTGALDTLEVFLKFILLLP